MKKAVLMILLCCAPALFAQQLNDYKYVIIPETFEFTEGVDQYRLNSISKFYFDQAGFETLMQNATKPEDYQMNNCMGLTLQPENNSGLFKTKLIFKLVDCNNKVIYESKEGRSSSKDYEVAYQEALKSALENLQDLNYQYSNPESEISAPSSNNEKMNNTNSTEENQELPETVIVSAFPEVITRKVETEANTSDEKISQSNSENKTGLFFLRKLDNGQGLFQQNASEPLAILYPTEKSGIYIYSSLVRQGIAYEQDDQLIVEYFDRQANSVKKSTYSLKDQ